MLWIWENVSHCILDIYLEARRHLGELNLAAPFLGLEFAQVDVSCFCDLFGAAGAKRAVAAHYDETLTTVLLAATYASLFLNCLWTELP